MTISTEEVRQIAALARLELEPLALEAMARDLASILAHIRELEEVDTSGVTPMEGANEHPAPMRDDAPGPDVLALPLEEFAPAFEESFFVVPRLAALDADALLGEGDSA